MGLFKTTKSNNKARRPPSLPMMIREEADDDNESSVPTHKKWGTKKLFPLLLLKRSNNDIKQQHWLQQPLFNDLTMLSLQPSVFKKKQEAEDDDYNYEVDDEDLGDIPRSISTPSRDMLDPLPPLPPTPKDDEEERLKQIWHQLQQYHHQQNKTPEFNSEYDELDKEEEVDHDQDSLGSPCEIIFKRQQLQRQRLEQMSLTIPTAVVVGSTDPNSSVADTCRATDTSNETNKKGIDTDSNHNGANIITAFDAAFNKLQAIMAENASIKHLPHYIAVLSPSMSPDTSAELSSRALSCLFTLSEVEVSSSSVTSLNQQQKQRVDMVHGLNHDSTNTVPPEPTTPLISALVSFLLRCPQNSSEQYLTLLVLNNLSIPMQNKRAIALQYDGAKILARLLCEDPGCHLLVIIIVNLTFGDLELNRDLLTMGRSGGTSTFSCHGAGDNETDVLLVQSLGYVFLLASLTAEQLATVGPIPLTSPDGTPNSPSQLLSLLFASMESKLNFHLNKGCRSNTVATKKEGLAALPPSMGRDDFAFPETARWCLGALKNLLRPSKLSPSNVICDRISLADTLPTNDEEDGALIKDLRFVTHNNMDASAIAAHAILDAGILPILLHLLNNNEAHRDSALVSCAKNEILYNWQSNSAQDSALYTLMHMSSVPQVRKELRENYGCIEVLTNILTYGKKVFGERLLTSKDDKELESLSQLRLQCLKARLALSYLAQSSESTVSKYESPNTVADHETHTLVELLSHSLQGRGMEGGCSSATFTLKGVLYAIRCILSEPKNRQVFAASTGSNGRRLNTLLLKAVARYSTSDAVALEVMDEEAVEHALVSIYEMSLFGLDDAIIGFACSLGRGTFLPAVFGKDVRWAAKKVVTKVLMSYLKKDGMTARSRYAANQLLLRLDFVRFAGTVADLTYAGKTFPSRSDFDFDSKLLSALNKMSGDDNIRTKGAIPTQHIFDRAISRKERSGSGCKTFSNALMAAEELAVNPSKQKSNTPIDSIALANTISYFADKDDNMFYGYTWKWEDDRGSLSVDIFSAAEVMDLRVSAPREVVTNDTMERSEPYSPPRKGFLGSGRLNLCHHQGSLDDNEPYSMFGLRCGAHICSRDSTF